MLDVTSVQNMTAKPLRVALFKLVVVTRLRWVEQSGAMCMAGLGVVESVAVQQPRILTELTRL